MALKTLPLVILVGLIGCASSPPRTDKTDPAPKETVPLAAADPASAGHSSSSDAVASEPGPDVLEPDKAVSALSTRSNSTLVFFDSRIFDTDLSAAMRAAKPEIVVDVPVGFNLNQIPERVDRWLYYVKDSGGTVVAEPEIRHRGIFSVVVDVIVMFVGKLDEKTMFSPSEQYQAKLVYKQDGTVSRIVFNQR